MRIQGKVSPRYSGKFTGAFCDVHRHAWIRKCSAGWLGFSLSEMQSFRDS